MKAARVRQHVVLVMLVAALFVWAPCYGAEIDLGTAYMPDELEKVRQWEKTWVGKRITRENVEQVADFFPTAYVGMIKNPEKWGAPAEGFYFTIVPYKRYTATRGMREATQKYASMVAKPGPDGTIANYGDIAGRPFPKPQNGLEIAYNIDFNNHGDASRYRRYCPNINPKSKSERLSDQEYVEYYWMHRTEVEPRPVYPENKKGYRRGMFTHMFKPAEFLNTRMYTVRYIDQTKDDDTYMWYAQFRRIRRLSTSQRTDSIDGSDLIYDDEYLWDGQILRNNYTFTGKKDLLSSRHQDMKKTERISGQAMVNGLTFERCNTLVVEAVNKDPSYIYSKRVWYIDPESYLILWEDVYDEAGRFWKSFMNNTCPLPTKQGDEKMFIVGTCFPDFMRTHSGLSNQQHFYEPEISSDAISPKMFTISSLQKTY
ncbi:MAG: DUF1329 domain-containing protein [Deltaproteobacteria bacterium]|nr:DUF1329 domain-containing protein [Deltaproteobacteria bacterium]